MQSNSVPGPRVSSRAWVNVGERILLTMWVGGVWAVGFLAVPALFHGLPDNRALAGELAGNMFAAISIVGLIATTLLLVAAVFADTRNVLRNVRVWLVAMAFVLVALFFFVLRPVMHELRSGGVTPGTPQAQEFAQLHRISSGVYGLTSLVGLVLVVIGVRRPPTP